jgi:predicted Zn finger-like uncharacterized protein
MLLACPLCATIYDVSRNVIGAHGRSLRCARCQTVWFATRSQELLLGPQPASPASTAEVSTANAQETAAAPIAEATAPAQGADAAPPAISPLPAAAAEINVAPSARMEDIESAARRRELEAAARARRLREQLGSPAIIAVLALLVALLFAWRTPIVRIAPQMASFYAAIGMPVNLRDLVFQDVTTFNETRDGVPTLVIEGKIASIARAPVEVPELRLALRDANRLEIVSWTAAPEQTSLAPGEKLTFRSRLATPPEHGHDVVVRFLAKRDPTKGGL